MGCLRAQVEVSATKWTKGGRSQGPPPRSTKINSLGTSLWGQDTDYPEERKARKQ